MGKTRENKMSNYNLQIAWSGKDALGDTDPDKVVSGGDFNTEFLAVKTAVNSKADLAGSASQAFAATTASAGTNTTQVATTAFVTTATAGITAAYPVGAIFTTVTAYANSAAVVNAIGGTTWVVFATGRTLVGVDTNDANFNTVQEEGGASTHTLSVAELPSHTHALSPVIQSSSGTDGEPNRVSGGQANNGNVTAAATGGGGAHNNLQPYITVYMWRRTQ